jgi:hypothetical protein
MLEIAGDLLGIQYRCNNFQITLAAGTSGNIDGEDPFQKACLADGCDFALTDCHPQREARRGSVSFRFSIGQGQIHLILLIRLNAIYSKAA